MSENPYESPQFVEPPEPHAASPAYWVIYPRTKAWILVATFLNLMGVWYLVTFVPASKPFGFVVYFVAVQIVIHITATIAKSICRFLSDRA